jgi:hypothetical protein
MKFTSAWNSASAAHPSPQKRRALSQRRAILVSARQAAEANDVGG